MSAPDFLVHDSTDTVGVVVVEGVQAGQELTGLVMDTSETTAVKALDPIPLGHKVALTDIRKGDMVIKYDNHIGKAVADIKRGGHAHTQNVKTNRW